MGSRKGLFSKRPASSMTPTLTRESVNRHALITIGSILDVVTQLFIAGFRFNWLRAGEAIAWSVFVHASQ